MLNYLYPFPENSPLVAYIRKVVRAAGQKSMGVSDKKQENGEMAVAQAIPNELVAIFKRISDDIFCGVNKFDFFYK